MTYAIIGFGAVGQALARMFARKGIDVTVATTRLPEAIATQAEKIGSNIVPKSLADALQADTLLLAVPYWAHRDIAKTGADWHGKTIIDVTNAYGVSPEQLYNLPSSVVLASAFAGASVVKGFNHLPAAVLAQDPAVHGGRRVIFLSGDHDQATTRVADLVERLGFAPVKLGKLSQGGTLVQAHGTTWAALIFQDLVKFN